MLAMANKNGYVFASEPGLANRARVPLESVLKALERFQSPDPYSRHKEKEGRRIEPIDGGWRLLSYQSYREKDNPNRASLDMDGYVYYVGTTSPDDPIKIGFSKNPWSRLNDLRVTNPQLQILATERGTMQAEKDRHSEFMAENIEGEWFNRSESLQSLIAELSNRIDKPKPLRSRPTGKLSYRSTEAEAEAEAGKSKARGTRIPESFVPKDSHYDLAQSLMVNCEMEFVKFRDHFLGVSGKTAIKCDWDAAFRNWLRRSVTYGARNVNTTSKVEERTQRNREAILAGFGLGQNARPSSADNQAGSSVRRNELLAGDVQERKP